MNGSSKHKITVLCTSCRERVNIEDLPAHRRRYHALEMNLIADPIKPPKNTQEIKAVESSNPPVEVPTREFTTCPICTVRVKTARLTKHLAKVHPNATSPYQPPRVQEVKSPVRDDNLAGKKSVRTVGSQTAERPVIHRSVLEHETRQRPNENKPIGESAGELKSRSTKSKKARPKNVKRVPPAKSRRWNISKAISSERRFQNEDFVKPTPSPSYIVRKSYFDHVRVAEEKLDHCPHGVSRFRICAICDPEKFREMTGMD